MGWGWGWGWTRARLGGSADLATYLRRPDRHEVVVHGLLDVSSPLDSCGSGLDGPTKMMPCCQRFPHKTAYRLVISVHFLLLLPSWCGVGGALRTR